MKFFNLLFVFLASFALSLPIQDENGNYFVKRGDKQIYIPNELRNNDFNNDANRWSFKRSKASANLVVFWEQGFGVNPKAAGPEMQFDPDDLLAKGERYYEHYRNTLKFVAGPSKADTYKMSIWVNYQTKWLATGAGYDNIVGAIWVNPGTMHPVGGTIAHEIGHGFQYQIHCDGRFGYRDQDYLGTYWEICAQWMATRHHPEMFNNQGFELLYNNCFKHPLHEVFRYQSILFNEYWSEKHGIDVIGKIWNAATNTEDPFDTYKRIMNMNQEALNDEMFLVAQKNILFEYKHMGPVLKQYRNRYNIKLQAKPDGTYQISPEQCTQSYGYAPVPLQIPANGKVTAQFTGIVGDRAYHTHEDAKAGWRYGFVAVTGTGETAVYSKAFVGTTQTSSGTFEIPAGTKDLWFIAMGAPKEHIKHHWKEGDNSRDEQFPWKVAFSTCLRGQNCTPAIQVDAAAAPAPAQQAAPAPAPAQQAAPAPAPAQQAAPAPQPAPQPAPAPVQQPAPAPIQQAPIQQAPARNNDLFSNLFGNFKSSFPFLDDDD